MTAGEYKPLVQLGFDIRFAGRLRARSRISNPLCATYRIDVSPPRVPARPMADQPTQNAEQSAPHQITADICVIGAGAGGLTAAAAAAAFGSNVVLIEKSSMGGETLHGGAL